MVPSCRWHHNRWYNGVQNENQEPSKTFGSQCVIEYRVPNKQKSSTISLKKLTNLNIFGKLMYSEYVKTAYNLNWTVVWKILHENMLNYYYIFIYFSFHINSFIDVYHWPCNQYLYGISLWSLAVPNSCESLNFVKVTSLWRLKYF